MRRRLLAVCLGVLLAPAAAAAAGPGARVTGVRGSVLSISADAGRVAIRASLVAAGRTCQSASVWQPATGTVTRIDVPGCYGGADGPQDLYAGLTLSGGRVGWVDYTGGNHTYCSGPYTATLASPRRAGNDQCDPTAGDTLWELAGGGSTLAARSWTDCEANCAGKGDATVQADVVLFLLAGADPTRLGALPDDTALLDADGGRILLGNRSTGRLVLETTSGKTLLAVTVPGRAFDDARLDGTTIVFSRRRVVQVLSIATGKVTGGQAMAPGARLAGASGGLVAYDVPSAHGATIRTVRLATGRDVRVAVVAGTLAGVELDPAGLSYAWNVARGGARPGRVAFVPARSLS